MAVTSRKPAVLLFPVDDTDASQRVFRWLLDTVYHNGDELHLLHVVPRIKFQASLYAVPAIDYVPQIDRDKYEAIVRKAEEFIVRRFLSVFPADSSSTPIVHIIKSEIDSDSVGHIVCQKAEDLQSSLIIMASHNRSTVAELFLGSVSQYVLHHCKRPILIAKGV